MAFGMNACRLSLKGLPNLLLPKSSNQIQVAYIVSKLLRDKDYVRPAPFPYRKKAYTSFHALFDKTIHRLDENSKVIVVDGPLAVGKTAFAKQIADDFDMYYVSHANLDLMYKTNYDYHLKDYNDELPDSLKVFEICDFLANPKHTLTTTMQYRIFMVRLWQYMDSLAHLLNTGQGMVLDRSVYSDFVFIETMHKFGWFSKNAKNDYYDMVENTVTQLMHPHLVIYLDAPVDKVMENIKKRNIPYEKDSPFCQKEVLTFMEKVYKQQFLKEMHVHSELLVYDWSEGGDPEVVVEDIERIDFDSYEKHDKKCKDWRLRHKDDWCEKRWLYTTFRDQIMRWTYTYSWDVPEIIASGEDVGQFFKVLDKIPGCKYASGYNKDAGDTNILMKVSEQDRNIMI